MVFTERINKFRVGLAVWGHQDGKRFGFLFRSLLVVALFHRHIILEEHSSIVTLERVVPVESVSSHVSRRLSHTFKPDHFRPHVINPIKAAL